MKRNKICVNVNRQEHKNSHHKIKTMLYDRRMNENKPDTQTTTNSYRIVLLFMHTA